jgi:signal transduction histidine kinase
MPEVHVTQGALRRAAEPPPPCCAEVLGTLLTGDDRVHPEDRVQEVAARFFERPDLEAVALVRDGRPVGLLTRARLLVKLARNFGHELYARKPVTRVADLAPLVLAEDTPLAEVLEHALARPGATVFDDVIAVSAAGGYAGHASVRELARRQNLALERSRLEHEAALSRTRDLEALERARSQFLAHATHELRSPVSAIAVLAELLRMSCEQDSLEGVRAKVPMLLRSAATLRGTVNNILDLSKLEAGRMDVSLATVEVAPLLEEVAALARLLVGEKPVEVRAEVAPELALRTDAHKLRQILVNLASNAAKFTERGAITLRAAATAPAPSAEGGAAGRGAPGGTVRFAVADTGCGIRAEDLPRLFVPFGQLEDAHTKTHAGTGLGLVITRSLASLLGGRVLVDSRRGTGSTFTVELPGVAPAQEIA